MFLHVLVGVFLRCRRVGRRPVTLGRLDRAAAEQ